jgi:hypothetical protein
MTKSWAGRPSDATPPSRPVIGCVVDIVAEAARVDIAYWLHDRNWIGCRKGVLEGFVQRFFLLSALVSATIVLKCFASRIDHHFCFLRPPKLTNIARMRPVSEPPIRGMSQRLRSIRIARSTTSQTDSAQRRRACGALRTHGSSSIVTSSERQFA